MEVFCKFGMDPEFWEQMMAQHVSVDEDSVSIDFTIVSCVESISKLGFDDTLNVSNSSYSSYHR